MTDEPLDFKPSSGFSMGVELELQILNSRDYNLARDAADLIGQLEKTPHPGAVKPEITESMIEINTSIHREYGALAEELKRIRDAVAQAAARMNLRIAGGGSHPFHKWTDRRIYPTERFKHLLELYGYLAKQFTIFGQHVHVGVPNGDEALYLTHILSRYVPHFIALSASSPFQQGEDTSYQSSRLNTVSAFPLSGQVPFVHSWSEFLEYFNKMRGFGIVESMKDFYWDIRPKPEYGTVEIRVFDTPLTVERAAVLAAYMQSLARYILTERPLAPSRDVYALYNYNRFQACRYGLAGQLVDAYSRRRVVIREDILDMIRVIARHAGELGAAAALEQLAAGVAADGSDARWLRESYRSHGSLNDVARMQSELWMGSALVSA
ncbi:MAG: glutamate--cysteine ligase [Betaproteobacteria bacterium RIFCSPLOWO2_12_FULL_62_58]|nr:MAG: glutamate--cysteine ligase [Betaproteobacteria bacterium RIFCSPLOWO2_12_FULL_62_58]